MNYFQALRLAILAAVTALATAGCGVHGMVVIQGPDLNGTWAGSVVFSQGPNSAPGNVTMTLQDIGGTISGTLSADVSNSGSFQEQIDGSSSGDQATLTAPVTAGCTEVDHIALNSNGNVINLDGNTSGACFGGGYEFTGVLIRQ